MQGFDSLIFRRNKPMHPHRLYSFSPSSSLTLANQLKLSYTKDMLLYRNLVFVRQLFTTSERVFYTLGKPELTDPHLVEAAARNWPVLSRVVFPEENIQVSNYEGWASSEGTSNLTRELDAFYQIAIPIALKVSRGVNIQTAIKEEIAKQTYHYQRNGFPFPTNNFLYICRLLIVLYNINLNDRLANESVRDFMRLTENVRATFSRIPPFPTEEV